MAKLILFGTGDMARLACYYFTKDSDHDVIGFCVDREYRAANEFMGFPLIAFEDIRQLYPPDEYRMFVAIGYSRMNQLRAAKYKAAKTLGYELVSYVSTRCTFLTEHPIGDNCFILEDNTVQPFVRIGHDVVLWSGCHIGHDTVIGNHCYLAGRVGVAGRSTIGHYSFIGGNTTLGRSLQVAERTLIGAGSVLMKDTVEGGVYLPRQAKLYSRNSDEIDL